MTVYFRAVHVHHRKIFSDVVSNTGRSLLRQNCPVSATPTASFVTARTFGLSTDSYRYFTSVTNGNDTSIPSKIQYQRVWSAVEDESNTDNTTRHDEEGTHSYWTEPLQGEELKTALSSIGKQEKEGGRMHARQLGVLREDPVEDMRLLIRNYTVPSLASGLRDREEILQRCASLLNEGRLDDLAKTLRPFERRYVELRRLRKNVMYLNAVNGGFNTVSLEMLRKGLMRMPRRVSQAHQHRAGVVLPLCNVNGVPSILFEKRSRKLRAHPDEVCLPGGMVSTDIDQSIAATCLREMKEEIEGLDMSQVVVLGILRCNWGEVAQLTGIAVTPLVCFLGEIGDMDLKPNPDEVSECFTVPISAFLQKDQWIYKDDSAPIFTGGPHIIWGLTCYVIDRFFSDVLARYTINLHNKSL